MGSGGESPPPAASESTNYAKQKNKIKETEGEKELGYFGAFSRVLQCDVGGVLNYKLHVPYI